MPLRTVQFLTVTSVIGVAPTEPTQRTLGEVVLVFSIVRLRSDPPLFEPSMVTKLAPLSLIMELLGLEPLSVAMTPVAGLIVIVLIALAPEIALITIGKTSPTVFGT